MRLYLMQHGKSKSKEEDPDRSLTDEGRSEVERVAAFLARTAPSESIPIRHSGKTRARETAAIASAVGDLPDQFHRMRGHPSTRLSRISSRPATRGQGHGPVGAQRGCLGRELSRPP